MAKTRSVYVCQNCGTESAKWIGKCPSCQEWNTYTEKILQKQQKGVPAYKKNIDNQPQVISSISSSDKKRINTCNGELNAILGGGIVPGSIILIGGEPGIGKSTLALQIALNIKTQKTLYISGEESGEQLKLRAERIGVDNDQCYILNETLLEEAFVHIENLAPDLLIIDSIQTLYTEAIESSPGSISQIRECAGRLMQFAKTKDIPVFLIGHINKEGHIAGPKVLEHIVDTVLQFEGDQNHMYRILRSTKNRFGSTSELGIFEMQSSGLKEIKNPSEILVPHIEEKLSGVAISASIDGIRPFLIEVQALVSSAVYGTPQRAVTGFDLRRLNMLLAVLEKKAGFKLGIKDVFLNLAGGIRINDPAMDLAVICAILSSNFDKPLHNRACYAAEIGLSGEIRPVTRIDERIKEAEKMGFEYIYISKYNKPGIKPAKIKIQLLNKVENMLKHLF